MSEVERMEDYKEELEKSFRKLKVGDIVTGTIIFIAEDSLTLDLDYYAPGIITMEEITDDPGFVVDEHYKVGDQVKATIIRVDDGAGNILLSMKEATGTLSWDELLEDKEAENVFSVKVLQSVNGGVVAYAKGIRGFIPASQLDLSYVEDVDTFVNKTLDVTPITVDKEHNKLVLSAKVVLKKRQEEEIARKMSHLIPGDVYEGVVDSIMPYGAFIDLGDGLSGLLHISRISQKRLNSPSEVLKVGQQVKVKLLKVEDGKISLSMKELEENMDSVETDEVEVIEYREDEISTSLGSLLSGIRLD
ncbi:MAG: S1 RNA-binding domain-containing protein [Lachnospiraceae bacterium]|nr:S1 RNA-binding domain-containing protein [Lachnospiraceae bacterium]